MISYRASKGCQSLLGYVGRVVQSTSVESYHELWSSGLGGDHCRWLYEVYEEHLDGVTDQEAKSLLHYKNVFMDASSVSARRNDLNKSWCRAVDERGWDVAQHLIVVLGERENVHSGRGAKVWGVNPMVRSKRRDVV